MPTPNNQFALTIGGKIHADFASYEIDSDLLIPADAWQFDLASTRTVLPDFIQEGVAMRASLDGTTILTGVIDDIDEQVAKGQHSVSLTGRDLAGQLLDCSAPIFDGQQLDLKQILTQFLAPFGIKYRIEAAATAIREKVTVEPGETVWEVIAKAAEANGLWQWFTAEGVLTVGEPNPKTPIVAHLMMRRDGVGNNVESVSRRRSLHERYSTITVLSQSAGSHLEAGKHDIKADLADKGVGLHRPKIITSGDCENIQAARAKAKKLMVDGQLNSQTLTVTVKGHYSETGVLWQPRQRVTLLSEPHNIDGIYFIMGRKFKLSRATGKTTELRLRVDGIWSIDPYKAKARKRKGKKAVPYEELELVQ